MPEGFCWVKVDISESVLITVFSLRNYQIVGEGCHSYRAIVRWFNLIRLLVSRYLDTRDDVAT